MLSRRTFIKGLAIVPVVACIPIVKPKPKPKPDIILTQTNQFITAYASIVGIERKPLETDIELRDRILTKMSTT